MRVQSEMGHRIQLALTCSWWALVGEMGVSGCKLMQNEWAWDMVGAYL